MTDSIKLINYSRNWDNMENNLDKCCISTSVQEFVNDNRFSEKFIINNITYFEKYIKFIVKNKKDLSDDFFNKIFTKANYSELKMTRKLLEPYRNFKYFDDIFY